MTDLRKLIWLYLLLLLFEGALRKWVIPALDAPLLLVRDPLVIWIYYQAMRQRLSFNNIFCVANLGLAVITTLLSFAFGIAGAIIIIYGIRTDFLQVPLIFLIPQILDRDDVIAMGRFLLYLAPPMAALVILQFLSPPDGYWNRGSAPTHYGSVRPSATFSFVAGLGAYFSLTAAFLLYGFIRPGIFKIWLMVLVTFCVIGATACSGSRSSLVLLGIVTLVAVLCVVTRGKGGVGLLVAGVMICLTLVLLSNTSVFHKGTAELGQRFTDAGRAEGNTAGFINRFFDTMLVAGDMTDKTPFFGYGLGLGTNAGLGIYENYYHGTLDLMWPESDWGRLVFECGPIFGILLCLFRVALTVSIGLQAFACYRRDEFLPMLIFAALGLQVLNGQWGVPTSLGFAIFGGGLMLAACVDPPDWHEDDDEHEHDDEHSDHEPDPSSAADKLS